MAARDYRFFKLNYGGVVDTAQVIRLSNDDAALTHARAFGDGSAVEVWASNQKIATLPPAARR